MVENAKRNLEEKGFKKEDIDKNDKELRDRFKQDAERQVRLLFILDEIADSEGIKVDPEDMNIAYKEIAARAGRTEPQVREHYEKEDLSDSLEEKIREGKTIKFLLDNSEIKESD
jgi:trigger factor